jgi:hypothetical protein
MARRYSSTPLYFAAHSLETRATEHTVLRAFNGPDCKGPFQYRTAGIRALSADQAYSLRVIRFQAGLLLARRMRDHNAHRLELLDAALIAYVQLSPTAYRPRRARCSIVFSIFRSMMKCAGSSRNGSSGNSHRGR